MMKIKLYQVNIDRDENQVCFCNLDTLPARQGTDKIDSSVYDLVWQGDFPCYTLDGVYCKLNTDHPLNYTARSMSVSDIVEVVDDNGPEEKGFYFCDRNDFKPVDFNPTQAGVNLPKSMRVVLVDPGKPAEAVDILTTYDDLHNIIDGYLECINLEPGICMVCNEEGKLNGSAPNRALYDGDGDVMDIVFGRFFICDGSTDSFDSLSEEKIKEYLERFKNPERFNIVNGHIEVTRYDPKTDDYF